MVDRHELVSLQLRNQQDKLSQLEEKLSQLLNTGNRRSNDSGTITWSDEEQTLTVKVRFDLVLVWFGWICFCLIKLVWFDLIGLNWLDLVWFDFIWQDLTWLDLIWFDFLLLDHGVSYILIFRLEYLIF